MEHFQGATRQVNSNNYVVILLFVVFRTHTVPPVSRLLFFTATVVVRFFLRPQQNQEWELGIMQVKTPQSLLFLPGSSHFLNKSSLDCWKPLVNFKSYEKVSFVLCQNSHCFNGDVDFKRFLLCHSRRAFPWILFIESHFIVKVFIFLPMPSIIPYFEFIHHGYLKILSTNSYV